MIMKKKVLVKLKILWRVHHKFLTMTMIKNNKNIMRMIKIMRKSIIIPLKKIYLLIWNNNCQNIKKLNKSRTTRI